MTYGIASIAGNCFTNVYQQNKVTEQKEIGNFGNVLATKGNESTASVEEYTEYLKKKFGANVIVQDVGKDQKSIDALGASTAGYNNVVIAPNILEQMASDSEKAAYYENKIQTGLDNFPKVQAQLSAAGFEIYSYGVGIESDGTVYTYTCGDLKPEVRAKIEAQVKAEQEEKRNRREKYEELGKEAVVKRREFLEKQNETQVMSEILYSRVLDMGVNSKISNQTQSIESAVAAYENAVTSFTNNS